MYKEDIEMVLGSKSRARHKDFYESLEGSFKNPIIHKEIHGNNEK